MSLTAFTCATIFDGSQSHSNAALLVNGKRISGIVAENDIPDVAKRHNLRGGVIAPGFVDLQVNGGGGVLFNGAQSVETLTKIAVAHARLGTTALMPTLITDTPERIAAAIDAVDQAINAGVAGIAGLHLEGPHLSVARKGAHDPALIRPMEDADLDMLLDAAIRLPHLMITVAPENVALEQIKILFDAGVIVSLGHSNAPYEDCKTASEHGATCATHLFNAMSQLTGREPGLVGAALDTNNMHAGLIADGIHVSAASIKTALRAKCGPAAIFLITDAMSTVGSDITEFTLNGRTIYRQDNRLTLSDGTLAGANLDMPTALRFMVKEIDLTFEAALTMATSAPARVLGDKSIGTLAKDIPANFVHLNDALSLQTVWQNGAEILAPNI